MGIQTLLHRCGTSHCLQHGLKIKLRILFGKDIQESL